MRIKAQHLESKSKRFERLNPRLRRRGARGMLMQVEHDRDQARRQNGDQGAVREVGFGKPVERHMLTHSENHWGN